MPYLLDTCFLSELRKSDCNPGVNAWIETVQPEDIFVSVITLGEIRRGIELRRRKDPKAAAAIERWFLTMQANYAERTLPVSIEIADRWGRICLTQPLPSSDGLIAATGLEHRLTVVTRNVSDFERSGVTTLNPFS